MQRERRDLVKERVESPFFCTRYSPKSEVNEKKRDHQRKLKGYIVVVFQH